MHSTVSDLIYSNDVNYIKKNSLRRYWRRIPRR